MKHYTDNFAHDNLPSLDIQPDYTFTDLPQFQHTEMLNCVDKLLDTHLKEGRANNPCIRTFKITFNLKFIWHNK